MLYLLISPRKQAVWQTQYEKTYASALTQANIPFQLINLQDPLLAQLTTDDYLWVMHYEDLTVASNSTSAKIMYRMSGTATHPYCYQVDMDEEDWQLTNVIDVNLSFHPRMSEYVRKFYPDANIWDTGYPIQVAKPTAPAVRRKPRSIVVGGRLSPDKQFMLTAFLLQPYLERGYSVTFCYPDNAGKDSAYLEAYGGSERYERLGFKFKQMNNSEWVNTLAKSEFYFTASLGDTACVSAVEAVTLGCYPLVPRIGKGLPVYDTYIGQGYEPFSVSDLNRLITEKPEVHFDPTWTSPALFANRLKEYMNNESRL